MDLTLVLLKQSKTGVEIEGSCAFPESWTHYFVGWMDFLATRYPRGQKLLDFLVASTVRVRTTGFCSCNSGQILTKRRTPVGLPIDWLAWLLGLALMVEPVER